MAKKYRKKDFAEAVNELLKKEPEPEVTIAMVNAELNSEEAEKEPEEATDAKDNKKKKSRKKKSDKPLSDGFEQLEFRFEYDSSAEDLEPGTVGVPEGTVIEKAAETIVEVKQDQKVTVEDLAAVNAFPDEVDDEITRDDLEIIDTQIKKEEHVSEEAPSSGEEDADNSEAEEATDEASLEASPEADANVVDSEKVQDTATEKKPAKRGKKKEGNMKKLENEIEINSGDELIGMNEDMTFITKGTVVNGDIEADGDMEVRGHVEGKVKCGGKLIVSGKINGDIETGDLYTESANLSGEIRARGTVKIGAGSVTVGNISAETAIIAGAVKGDMDIRDSAILDSTAVVVGNIKSKSVEISSGAIVDGFCKQSYSDVDVDKYFKSNIESL